MKISIIIWIFTSCVFFTIEAHLVNRDTFFEHVMGLNEPDFQQHADPRDFIQWDAAQNSFFLKNSATNDLFRAGKFNVFSIGELRDVTKNISSDIPGTFNVIEAVAPIGKSYYHHVDIGANQANPANKHAVFQVASNFNALELIGAGDDMADITGYIGDPTQGPFASISAAPGLIWRHYYMFYNPAIEPAQWQQYAILGRLWVPADANRQLNLLGNTDIPVVNSYVAFSQRSPEDVHNFAPENIEIGFHENIQITSGLMPNQKQHTLVNDPTQIIDQVFTAAVDFGSNHAYANNPKAIAIGQAVQDAGYEGTIRAAAHKARKKVVLTLIGGGVFYNKLDWIANAIERMKSFIEQSGLNVTLIIFDSTDIKIASQIPDFRKRMQKLAQQTGGEYIQYSDAHPDGKLLVKKESIALNTLTQHLQALTTGLNDLRRLIA